ncbi:anthrax toxin receptor-like [Dasypus novemcinctus]|uniref:anthrax toxin receptor-like n=1 Tax=Dasypus novemcinctus TaxID=9361 RepID=UPI0039C936E2
MRIAFITFDSQAYVSMDLTSDEEYLQQGLRRLMRERNLVPSSYVNVGLEKANMMMRKSSSQGRKVTRVVYALMAANIPQGADWLAAEEARKARKMGAIVFTIGANDFEQKQLEGIAHSKDHVFGVPDLNSLSSISSQVIEKSCIEIKYLEPTNVCMGESPDIKVHGRGFANALNKKDIICRFKFSRTKFKDKAASSSEDNVITCPGVEPQILGKPIFVEISLNKGITFITNNLKFRGKDCGENPAAKTTEDKAGNPSKVNSQRPIEQTPEKAPEMPQEAPPKNLPGKVPKQAPGKPPEKPPAKLFKRLAATALERLSKYRSGDADSSDERTDQEGTPEGEGGGEEAEPRGLEIPLPPLVESFISTGSSSSDFPWIPVVAGAAALLFLLLLCCFFYLCCWCKREPDPCRTVCCSPPCPMMITRCCDCPGTGHVRQMEGKLSLLCALLSRCCTPVRLVRPPFQCMGRCLTFAPVRAPCRPVVCNPATCAPPCREGPSFSRHLPGPKPGNAVAPGGVQPQGEAKVRGAPTIDSPRPRHRRRRDCQDGDFNSDPDRNPDTDSDFDSECPQSSVTTAPHAAIALKQLRPR